MPNRHLETEKGCAADEVAHLFFLGLKWKPSL